MSKFLSHLRERLPQAGCPLPSCSSFRRQRSQWIGRSRDRKFMIVSVLIPALCLQISAMAGNMEAMAMEMLTVSSPAFTEGGAIPARYSCDGSDINPPLQLGAPPPGTKSLTLIMDDPDAPVGTWVHWLVWNIPAATSLVAENALPAGAIEGKNSWKKNSYGGPCPPSGTHRYFFKVYALDKELHLSRATTKDELERAMQDHILARGELMGTYSRE